MKKIIFITKDFPYPADSGGKIKSLATIISLSKQYIVHAIFISGQKPDKKHLNLLRSKNITPYIVYNPAIVLGIKKQIFKQFLNYCIGKPHFITQYYSNDIFNDIQSLIKKIIPDVIHIDHNNLSVFLPKQKKQIWILENHNIEFKIFLSRFMYSRKVSWKIYGLIEGVLTYIFEKKTYKRFDHVFSISEKEKNELHKKFKINPITTYPVPYKLETNKKTISKKDNSTKNVFNILFIGSLSWPPNLDAVEWFVTEVMHKHSSQIKVTIQFHIVGTSVQFLKQPVSRSKNVHFHGYQDDITRFLSDADCFILPFRMGSGVRIKALTALASGIPIISTELGISGLNVRPNQEYLLAKSSQDFVEHINALANDNEIASNLSTNGMHYMEKSHNPATIEKIFLKKYASIINAHRSNNSTNSNK